MIAALQAQVADLKLGLKQANQVAARLMGTSLTYEERQALFELVTKHITEQDVSKSAQLIGVMRNALLELNRVAQSTTDPEVKQRLVELIKALTLTVGHASPDATTTKENYDGPSTN
jgi:2-hydroxychromene-2-carboxylate isomerase